MRGHKEKNMELNNNGAELIGVWRMNAMFSADESGTRMLSRDEVAALGDEDLNKLLRAEFHLSESALDMYYMPLPEEMETVKEEGWELTDKGVLLESYPAKIVDGVLMLDYEREGKEYFPVRLDDEGCLIISDGTMRLEKKG